MTHKISVIIPVYNSAPWLKRALNSIFNQSFCGPFEIIVIDDGSTDDSSQIIESLRRKHPNLKHVCNERNFGIVSSLNRGLDLATGDFIARMDGDDVALPKRFDTQVAFLREKQLDLCGSWFTEFGMGIPRAVRWPHTEAALRTSMLFQNSICHPTVMARREVFERYRYREDYRLAEDYDLFSRALNEFRIANVPKVLLYYRRHKQQATQAHRSHMEAVTRRIRHEVLMSRNITVSDEDMRLHNLIRAPHSITNITDLLAIESWLHKLSSVHEDIESKSIIASQWIRACIRAAPLGASMIRIYRASSMHGGIGSMIDLTLLSWLKLDYTSKAFAVLRRLGVSA